MPRSSLLIYSGGLDSTVLLYDQRDDIERCVYFDYGVKARQEYACAVENTSRLGVELTTINLENVFSMVSGSLLRHSTESVPDGRTEESTRSIIVPFRNGIFLSIAVALAESWGLKKVLIGAHMSQPAILPDCSLEFMGLMSMVATAGTVVGVRIDTPFMNLRKREIALLGTKYEVDFDKTWSCYKGERFHCGTCKACVERKEALEGFDPTEYMGARGDTWE